jgi:hypothetical protein
MQKDHQNAPAGTVLIEVEKDSAMLQAESIVKSHLSTKAYVIKGDDKPFSLTSDYVGELHPNDPIVTGPFVVTNVKVVEDRLNNSNHTVAYETSGQEATMFICIDDRLSNIVKDKILEQRLHELMVFSHIWHDAPFHAKGGYRIVNTQSAINSLKELMSK